MIHQRRHLILEPDLHPCLICEIHCRKCGPARIAIARSDEEAPKELNCPFCSAAAPTWLLGTGQTRRLLPYHDRIPDNFEIEQRSTLCDGGLLLRVPEFLRDDSQATGLDEVRARLAS